MPSVPHIIANYFEQGDRFHKTAPADPSSAGEKGTVFLLHGWGVRAASMKKMAAALTERGFTVFNYDYPSSMRTIGDHAEIFLELYRQTLARECIGGPVYFLTHSMGGIVLRGAMAKMTADECRRIDAIVMLGPPNGGSLLAHLGKNGLVRAFNASLGDMATDGASYVRNIPPPPFLPPVGIIAGRFDGKVALRNTLLPGGLPCRRTVVGCTHPGLRDPKNTLEPALYFFRHKSFR